MGSIRGGGREGHESTTITLSKQAQQLAPKLQACKQDSSHFQDENPPRNLSGKNNVGLYDGYTECVLYV
jgi:hypothetical protein